MTRTRGPLKRAGDSKQGTGRGDHDVVARPGPHDEAVMVESQLAALLSMHQAAAEARPVESDDPVIGPRHSGRLLGNLLIARGHLAEDDLEAALVQQRVDGPKLGEILVEMGLIDDRLLVSLLAEQLQVPVVDANSTAVDPAVGRLLPAPLARRLRAVPLRRQGERIEVAMADPADAEAVRALAHALRSPLRLLLAAPGDIEAIIDRLETAADAALLADLVGPRHTGRLLGNLLVTRGYLIEPDLEVALAHQARTGRQLGQVVVELGLLQEHTLVELLSEQLRLPVVDLTTAAVDTATGRLLPENVARLCGAVPFRRKGDRIDVAMVDPTDTDVVKYLVGELRAPMRLMLATTADLEAIIDMIFPSDSSATGSH
ncbi:MAG TPA: hypothetical protein VN636_12570 [Acidimicrobiia bacterium]|nr:hypothetical protein [Acidimicrobiia bacterium]